MFEAIIPFRARLTPRDPAVWTEAGETSYRRFDADIDRVAHALASLDLEPKSVVMVDLEILAIHWLVLMALERLGHTSISASVKGAGDPVLKLVGADGIISGHEPGTFPTLKSLSINGGWVGATLSGPRPAFTRSEPRPDDLIRIILSSGTTGQAKQIPITRESLDARLNGPVTYSPLKVRSYTTMGMSSAFGFRSPLVAWWLGGVAVMPQTFNQKMIEDSGLTNLTMSTQQLAVHLANHPEAFRGPRKVVLQVGGSMVPASLVEAVRARGGADLMVGYGATEISSMTTGDAALILRNPGSVGYVVPGVQVQIVTSDGAVLPHGEAGEVRIRTNCMISRYRGLDEGPTSLRDGWFYPGDLGKLMDDGELIIEGRADDLINIGGVKLFPFDVEERAKAWPGVADAAVVALPMASGRWVMFCAVATNGSCDTPGLEAHLGQSFHVTTRIVVLPSIKRNGMGKIERHAVRAALTESVNGPAAAPAT